MSFEVARFHLYAYVALHFLREICQMLSILVEQAIDKVNLSMLLRRMIVATAAKLRSALARPSASAEARCSALGTFSEAARP